MCFDSLTITGLVIFISAFVLVVRFCIFSPCGGANTPDSESRPPGNES